MDLGDSSGQHIVKYLKTITAWNAAVTSLLRARQFNLPLRSHSILLSSPSLKATDDFIDTLKTRTCSILAPWPRRDDVTFFLDSNKRKDKLASNKFNKTAIHPEAGLMAVVCAARSSTLPHEICDKLKDVFSVRSHD